MPRTCTAPTGTPCGRSTRHSCPTWPTRGDLDRVIRAMLSELAVGHSVTLAGGERLHEPKPIPVGLLAADYEVADGRFRFKTIYGGAFWDPTLRAPLKAPGVDVKPGEFLLAVDGREVKADGEVYRVFEGTVGKRVELKIGPARRWDRLADGGRRADRASEDSAAQRAWVEGNLRKVQERTKGRVAYVYVPNTADAGYEYVQALFLPAGRQGGDHRRRAVQRRRAGGRLLHRPAAPAACELLGDPSRRADPHAERRDPRPQGDDHRRDGRVGGDLLPWMFRKFGLGKLVGKRTWGGLVGILGFPGLMDGGGVTAPNLAIFTEDGWVVENVGVPPDIDVEQDPAAVAAGKDPQLDRAIELVLEALALGGPAKGPQRPPFPVRVRAASERVPRMGSQLTCRSQQTPSSRSAVRGAGRGRAFGGRSTYHESRGFAGGPSPRSGGSWPHVPPVVPAPWCCDLRGGRTAEERDVTSGRYVTPWTGKILIGSVPSVAPSGRPRGGAGMAPCPRAPCRPRYWAPDSDRPGKPDRIALIRLLEMIEEVADADRKSLESASRLLELAKQVVHSLCAAWNPNAGDRVGAHRSSQASICVLENAENRRLSSIDVITARPQSTEGVESVIIGGRLRHVDRLPQVVRTT